MFPEIRNIADVTPHLSGPKEVEKSFRRYDRDGYVVLDYEVLSGGIFGCLVRDGHDLSVLMRREARGLKFHPDTGDLIARPHPKFLNVGESPETQPDALDWPSATLILEKLDGSEVHPMVLDGGVEWATRKGHVKSANARAFARESEVDHEGFARAMLLGEGTTPIYEWCSRQDPIVLDHPRDRLVLTALRDNLTGRYADHDTVVSEARRWGIEVVPEWERNVSDPASFLENLKRMEGVEGVVVRWPDGYTVKAKTDRYRLLHNVLDDLEHERKVLAWVLNGAEDDVLPLLGENDASALRSYAASVRGAAHSLAGRIDAALGEARLRHGEDRKMVAGELQKAFSGDARKIALNAMAKGDALERVVEFCVSRQSGSIPDLGRVKALLSLPDWGRYRP